MFSKPSEAPQTDVKAKKMDRKTSFAFLRHSLTGSANSTTRVFPSSEPPTLDRNVNFTVDSIDRTSEADEERYHIFRC